MAKRQSHWPLTLLGGIASLLNVLLPLALVRALPQAEVGQYKIFFLYVGLSASLFFAAGITNGLSHWAGNHEKKLAATQTSWTVLVLVAALATVLSLGLAHSLGEGTGWSSRQISLFSAAVGLMILSTFFDEASVALGSVWRGAVFGSVFDVLRNLAMLFSALWFRSVDAVFVAHVSGHLAKLLVSVAWGSRLGFQRLAWQPGILREVLRYALPVSTAAFLSVATGYSDQILLSKFLAPSAFAIYSMGCLSLPPLLIFEQSVNRVLIPQLSTCFLERKQERALLLIRHAVSEMSWILIGSVVGLVFFARPIIHLLFTRNFDGSVPYLRMYAGMYLILALPYDAVARAKGDGTWILRRLVVFSTLSVALASTGAWLWDARGALTGALLAATAMRVSSMVSVAKEHRWSVGELLPWSDWARYGLWAGLGAIWIAGSYFVLMRSAIQRFEWVWFGVGGAGFSVIYLSGTWKIFRARQKHTDLL